MSKKRPRLLVSYSLMGLILSFRRGFTLLIIWDGQFPEPQLSNKFKFPRPSQFYY